MENLVEVLLPEDNFLFQNRPLSARERKTLRQFSESYCMTLVLQYIPQSFVVHLQILSRFYYKVQIPRSLSSVEVKLRKVRLHLFNHESIIIFNMQDWTKQKRKIKNQEFPHLWNCQSIEVKGAIFLTGGSMANTKTYVKHTYQLCEKTWLFERKMDMYNPRDAHGMIGWKDQHIIVVGSWHVEQSTKTVEIYNIQFDTWSELPQLNYATCAPGLIIIEDRYLYKVGGTTNIRKIERFDLLQPTEDWITINTSNQIGKKASINRCLLHPVNKEEFLVFGCHFGRSEYPFSYHLDKNEFNKFQKSEVQIDMYRSNDVVQIDPYSIFIRPFVKVGDSMENVKVLQYFIRELEVVDEDQNGPRAENRRNTKFRLFLRNLFQRKPKISTKPYQNFPKGHIEEVEFATTEWEN